MLRGDARQRLAVGQQCGPEQKPPSAVWKLRRGKQNGRRYRQCTLPPQLNWNGDESQRHLLTTTSAADTATLCALSSTAYRLTPPGPLSESTLKLGENAMRGTVPLPLSHSTKVVIFQGDNPYTRSIHISWMLCSPPLCPTPKPQESGALRAYGAVCLLVSIRQPIRAVFLRLVREDSSLRLLF
jgi:hypothetical protein